MAKNTTALDRARQRALGGDTPAPPVQPKPVARQRITIQARGREYPALDPGYYELSPDQQSAYLDALDDLEDRKKGVTLFDRTALAVMDIAQAQGNSSSVNQKPVPMSPPVGTTLSVFRPGPPVVLRSPSEEPSRFHGLGLQLLLCSLSALHPFAHRQVLAVLLVGRLLLLQLSLHCIATGITIHLQLHHLRQ